jgi:hypothetical protein
MATPRSPELSYIHLGAGGTATAGRYLYPGHLEAGSVPLP